MSDTEISGKILEITQTASDYSSHISQLTIAMVDLDEEQFERSLSGLFLRYNFEETVTGIVYPFLEKIGVLWQTDHITPGHEHFIANLIRQKMIVAIDGLPLPPADRERALLFLPEGELHEIGLLFYHYLTRKAGYRTIYLGQTVPHTDLKAVYAIHQPQILITSITTPLPDSSVEAYLSLLAGDFPCRQILVSGRQVHNLETEQCPPGVRILRNIRELKPVLREPGIIV